MKPRRIQRKRTKGWKMPPNTVYVGRPTKWGNPYDIWKQDGRWWVGWGFTQPGGSATRAEATSEATRLYKRWLRSGGYIRQVKRELRGKNLCCWCRLDDPCHADVLLELANQGTDQGEKG